MRSIVVIALLLIPPLASAEEWKTAKVAGQVADAAGKPLAGAQIVINRSDGATRKFGEGLNEATSDNSGHFEVKLEFQGEIPLKVSELWADLEGYVRSVPQFEIELTAGQIHKQDLRMEKGKILAGILRLPPDPFEAAFDIKQENEKHLVLVTGPNLPPRPYNAQHYFTEPDGRFAIYLPEGEYSIATAGGYSIQHEWTNLKAGRTDLVLELPPFEWTERELGKLFDELWDRMDRTYSYFFLKKSVNWQQLKEEHRPKAIAATNSKELAIALQAMLAPLSDLHVWIQMADGTILPTHSSGYHYNANRDVILAQLEHPVQCGKFALVAKTKPDGFGYLLMQRQSKATSENVAEAVEAIRALADAPGFIVDLRSADGGNENLAAEIAGLFFDRDTIYAKSKRRSGPAHTDFHKDDARTLPATEGAYTRPVVCLIGPGAVSSGEAFVQMMDCLRHVTTIGLPTRGASGNPAVHLLSRTGLVVYYSSWVDMMPNGDVIEGVGIPPDVRVEVDKAAYATTDPTLEKGLEILRAKIAQGTLARRFCNVQSSSIHRSVCDGDRSGVPTSDSTLRRCQHFGPVACRCHRWNRVFRRRDGSLRSR